MEGFRNKTELVLHVYPLYTNHMHVAVLRWRAGCGPGHLAPWALHLLLEACGGGAWLTVPVHTDETVVEDRLDAGYGPSGLFVFRVLDQRRLGVSTKNHLECVQVW